VIRGGTKNGCGGAFSFGDGGIAVVGGVGILFAQPGDVDTAVPGVVPGNEVGLFKKGNIDGFCGSGIR